MKPFYLLFLVALLTLACKKEQHATDGPKVEIYALKSFSIDANLLASAGITVITNGVLADEPFVADADIKYYTTATKTFRLRRDIKPTIKDYSADKGFAVTVNKQPVYYGKFHPAFLSSLTIGSATIDPVLISNNELAISFILIDNIPALQQLDKRNDATLINALQQTGRIR